MSQPIDLGHVIKTFYFTSAILIKMRLQIGINVRRTLNIIIGVVIFATKNNTVRSFSLIFENICNF